MWALGGAFAVSGVLHLVRPRPFEMMVPRRLPARRALVYASGVAELGCAAGMAFPRTRPLAGLVSSALLVMVFPANVQMALDASKRRSTPAKAATAIRLPLQLPLIWVAWRTWRQGQGAQGPQPHQRTATA